MHSSEPSTDDEYESASRAEKALIESFVHRPLTWMLGSLLLIFTMSAVGYPRSRPADTGSKRACRDYDWIITDTLLSEQRDALDANSQAFHACSRRANATHES